MVEDLKQLKFFQNTLKVEVDLLKAIMTPKKLVQIDETNLKVRDLNDSILIL